MRCSWGGIASEIRRKQKIDFAHRNGGIGGGVSPGGRAMGSATIARVAREENHGRAEFRESCKVYTFVSFFCGASFSDQLRIVAVSADEARDFLRGNLWSDFGRGLRRSSLPGAPICASGAGPGHPSGRAPALRARAACGSAGEERRIHDGTIRVAAVCERCGIAGPGEKSLGRKTDGAQSHQATHQELEAGLPASVVPLYPEQLHEGGRRLIAARQRPGSHQRKSQLKATLS